MSAPHYESAPLIEALLDIRVEPGPTVSVRSLASVQDAVRDEYPIRREERRFEQQLTGEGLELLSTTTRQTLIGYRFDSRDEKQLFHAHVDGFTFNRLAPYQQWDTFRDEARRLWQVYCSVAHPRRATRLAVRYINRFDLPRDAKFEDYLRILPSVPLEIPQAWLGFLMRIEIPIVDIDAMLILTEAIVEPRDETSVSIVLDIDVNKMTSMSPNGDMLWEEFEKFRWWKNLVFNACITDLAKERIR